MKKENIVKVIAIIIACLFTYAAISKLSDYDKSSWEMRNQIFPVWTAVILTWLIPSIELLLALLVLIPLTRKIALASSLVLLLLFTIYIAVVMTGVFGRIPCSCGGILKDMSYGYHLIFNLFFASLAFIGLAIDGGLMLFNRILTYKKRKGSLQNSV
jgi:uncharacterized membrane protein YphA (DoxX/SURF4 family)